MSRPDPIIVELNLATIKETAPGDLRIAIEVLEELHTEITTLITTSEGLSRQIQLSTAITGPFQTTLENLRTLITGALLEIDQLIQADTRYRTVKAPPT